MQISKVLGVKKIRRIPKNSVSKLWGTKIFAPKT